MALVSRKKLSYYEELLKKNNGNYYCINCLHSFRIEGKLKLDKNVCKSHDYCNHDLVKMLKKDNNVFKYNHGEKSM